MRLKSQSFSLLDHQNIRVLHCLKWSHRCSNPYAQASSRELSKHSKLVLPWSSLISRLPSLCWQRLSTWSFVYNFSSHWVNSATNQCRTGQTSQGKYIFCLSVICVYYLLTVWHFYLWSLGIHQQENIDENAEGDVLRIAENNSPTLDTKLSLQLRSFFFFSSSASSPTSWTRPTVK